MSDDTTTSLHVGPIHSVVAGRTDHLPIHVPSGSYVLPADIVSHAGENNTAAGFKVLKRVFGGTPYAGSKNPYGGSDSVRGQGDAPYGQSHGPYGMMKRGGSTGNTDQGVPIVAAGGEMVLSPDQVRACGGGDLDTGHKVLDEFVKRMRAELVSTLKKLPGPKKN